MPAIGVRAPARMFVAVRAMAPVAGRPPNSGDSTLATPCAVSSTFGSWRSPDMRSATTAESSDSIAPSMATVSAGDNSVRTRCGLKAGIRSSGRPAGTTPNREPIVSTGSPAAATTTEPRQQRDDAAGNAARDTAASENDGDGAERQQRGGAGRGPGRGGQDAQAAEELSRQRRRLQAEQIADLRAGDQDGDAVGEADHDRPRDVLHRGPEPGDAEQDQHHAGHQGAHEQPVEAVGGDDAGHDHHECPGGSADLHARAAERRDREAGDRAAIQAGLRRQPRCDGERHGQRQGDEPDGDAGDDVGCQQSGRVPFTPALDQLGQRDWRHRQAAHGADSARCQHIHILIYNYRR